MTDWHPTESLPAYSLGCLEHGEAEQVRKHLLTCMPCQSELKSLESVCMRLADTVPPALPGPELKQRLMSGHRSPGSYAWFDGLLNRWPRLVPVAVLASISLVVLFGTTSLFFWQQSKSFQPLRVYAEKDFVLLKGTENMPAAEGRLIADQNSGQGLLLVNALRPLETTMQYQLWLIRDGQRTSGAIFSVDERGMASILVSSAQPLFHYDSFGITIEPYGGSPAPTGQKVLGGKILL